MPTCPRCAVAALALAFVFAGCSSNNPDDIASFRGTYAISQLSFSSAGITTANVTSRLNAATSEVEVTGTTALVKFEYGASSGTCRATGDASGVAVMTASAGRNTLSLTARTGADRDVLDCLLLPDSFTLRAAETETTPQTLTATIENTRANLHDYDRDNYNAGLDNVEGTLDIRLARR